jgi:hypothetical protein
MESTCQILCPSAPPYDQGAQVFGIVSGTAEAPEVAYVPVPQPITDELLHLANPVRPGEVFRIAAPCACKRCGHFAPEAATCRLAATIVQWLPRVVDTLPPCAIRPACRWWQQEGQAACVRCPQVVTESFQPLPGMRDVRQTAQITREPCVENRGAK